VTEEETKTVLGLGSKLITGLPAQFLALVVINVIVLGGLFWHLDSQLESRERVLMKMVETCSSKG
jgi:hypothetical protein